MKTIAPVLHHMIKSYSFAFALALAFCPLLAKGQTNLSTFVLTPPPAAVPRINGPSVFGVRPAAPFLYTIPATGRRPMEFSAEGLPPGLSVDPQSGRITDKVEKAGEYQVGLKAKNSGK